MPPKKATTSKKGTQAKGWTSPCIIELLPSDPPSPGSSNLGEGSYYEAPTGNLATTLTLLAQSLSAPKKNSKQTKVWEPNVFDSLDTHKLQLFLVQCTLNFRNHPDAFSTEIVLKLHLHYLTSREQCSTGSNPRWPPVSIWPGLMITLTLSWS